MPDISLPLPTENEDEERSTRAMHPEIRRLSALVRILEQMPPASRKITLEWLASIYAEE